MQQQNRTTLCESENGRVSVVNNGVAYELNFRDIILILTSQQFYALRRYLERLDENEWFRSSEEEFSLVYFAPLCANYYMTRKDLQEMLKLLLEASAMIKVHQRLYFKTEKTRIN